MFNVAGPLIQALSDSRESLRDSASQTARAQTPFGPPGTDGAMAAVAQKAIFQEALLNAMHARLAEIKGVTHG